MYRKPLPTPRVVLNGGANEDMWPLMRSIGNVKVDAVTKELFHNSGPLLRPWAPGQSASIALLLSRYSRRTLQSGIDVPPPDYLFFRKMHTRTFLLQPPPPLINFEPRGNFPNQTKNCPAKVTRCECLLR